jgi:hypothetical protein
VESGGISRQDGKGQKLREAEDFPYIIFHFSFSSVLAVKKEVWPDLQRGVVDGSW